MIKECIKKTICTNLCTELNHENKRILSKCFSLSFGAWGCTLKRSIFYKGDHCKADHNSTLDALYISSILTYEQNKYVTSLMNNHPIFYSVNSKHHQLKLKRVYVAISCFSIFEEDGISISTVTFMNMKKRVFISMPSLIGQPPSISIYWAPAMS